MLETYVTESQVVGSMRAFDFNGPKNQKFVCSGTLEIQTFFLSTTLEARLLGYWIIGNRAKRESGQRHTTVPNGRYLLRYLLLQRTVLRTSLRYL
jgi:hypothetical protein